jgi:uncharacterized protein
MENCFSCFTCEKGVIPTITKEDLDKKIANGEPIPQEWFVQDNCESCVTCEKCFTAEGNCESCVSCEKCFTGQQPVAEDCINCFTCQKCDTAQEGNCEKCVTCEKCFTGQTGQPGPQGTVQSMTYFLFPTNECNLRCTYCYAEKTPPTMDLDMMNKAIAFIIFDEEKRVPNRQISIQFFGGEPTLKWDLLVHAVETMEKLAQEHLGGRKIKFGMTTNGTLLNEERLKWMKAHDFKPLLSLDGRRETHNKHRLYKDGSGSWDDIPFDLYLQYFPNPEIRPTILPDTVENWPEDLAWFHSKGCYNIATEVAYEDDWNDEAMEKAWKTYRKLADMYIDLRKKGQPVWMKFIQDGFNFLGGDRQTGSVCGIAFNSIAIDAKGKLFACQRYASFSNPALALGDIENGWDEMKLRQANNFNREMMFPDPKSGFDCETCVARWRCKGGCNAMNFQCNGDRRIILENHCKFQRMWAELSLYALSATGELHKKIQGGGEHTCSPRR